MGSRFLSRVSWGGTLIFMLMRVGFATVGLLLIFLVAGKLQGGNFLALPLAALFFSGMSLVAAWLAQVGLPFAGLVSIAFSIPMYLGDPMVWILHKVRPQWVPVHQPGFFNPPFVWVMNEQP